MSKSQAATSQTPWRIQLNDELSVKNVGGKHICQLEYDCAFNRNFELNKANAALIVRAVNLFEAHEAVVEAAIELDKVLALNGYNITGSKSLCNALAQLAKLKEAK